MLFSVFWTDGRCGKLIFLLVGGLELGVGTSGWRCGCLGRVVYGARMVRRCACRNVNAMGWIVATTAAPRSITAESIGGKDYSWCTLDERGKNQDNSNNATTDRAFPSLDRTLVLLLQGLSQLINIDAAFVDDTG